MDLQQPAGILWSDWAAVRHQMLGPLYRLLRTVPAPHIKLQSHLQALACRAILRHSLSDAVTGSFTVVQCTPNSTFISLYWLQGSMWLLRSWRTTLATASL